MTCESGTVIVSRALELRQRNPGWPAQQVLDAALDRFINTHPDFEACGEDLFCDWLDPPSAFARLLQEALAPELSPDDFSAESERWQDVVEAFADRYNLWR